MTSTTPSGTGKNTTTMLAGRQADSQRRRQRVITALNRAAAAGDEISVEMCQKDVADLELQFFGVGQILLNIALRVNNDGGRTLLVSQ